jgi:hypothetical protein
MTGTATIREAVAVFDDQAKLENAISELQSHGVDRSDLSFLAHQSLTDFRDDDSRRLMENPATPREPPVTDTDIRQGRVLGTGLAAAVAGLMAAGFTVATGGVAAATIAAAAAAGGIGAAGALVGRKLGKDETSFLDAQLERGGVLLWVRIRDRDIERRALEILRRYSRAPGVRPIVGWRENGSDLTNRWPGTGV